MLTILLCEEMSGVVCEVINLQVWREMGRVVCEVFCEGINRRVWGEMGGLAGEVMR